MDANHDLGGDVEPGRYLVLTVADTGCGISPKVKDRIFEPFFTTKDAGKGTGLGLAMVYGIVQQHHGAIKVYSDLGIGTTFQVYLPAVESKKCAHQPLTKINAPGGTEMILVAEDDSMVREVAVRILEQAGYRTLAARDGEEAVQLLQQHATDVSLAILDVVMPQLGGRDAYQRMVAIRRDLPAIFCSGYEADMTQVQFIKDFDLPLIEKPYDSDELLHTVREMLNGELTAIS
jgi:CheY-like chemotaxis protein